MFNTLRYQKKDDRTQDKKTEMDEIVFFHFLNCISTFVSFQRSEFLIDFLWPF